MLNNLDAFQKMVLGFLVTILLVLGFALWHILHQPSLQDIRSDLDGVSVNLKNSADALKKSSEINVATSDALKKIADVTDSVASAVKAQTPLTKDDVKEVLLGCGMCQKSKQKPATESKPRPVVTGDDTKKVGVTYRNIFGVSFPGVPGSVVAGKTVCYVSLDTQNTKGCAEVHILPARPGEIKKDWDARAVEDAGYKKGTKFDDKILSGMTFSSQRP